MFKNSHGPFWGSLGGGGGPGAFGRFEGDVGR